MAEPQVTVGTIGHFEHGKTTLAAAIIKLLRLEGYRVGGQFEKLAGTTTKVISDGEYSTNQRNYRHLDFPGKRDYTSITAAGVSALDAAILVVSAPDGPMPQTREHLILARQGEVDQIVVYLSKIDVMDDEELLELIELEIRELLDNYAYPGDEIPIIRGSAIEALNSRSKNPNSPEYGSIRELLRVLDGYITAAKVDKSKGVMGRGFESEVYLLEKMEGGLEEALVSGERADFYIGGHEVGGEIGFESGIKQVEPGYNAVWRVNLDKPVPMRSGQYFSVRRPFKTIAAGVITETYPEIDSITPSRGQRASQVQPVSPTSQKAAKSEPPTVGRIFINYRRDDSAGFAGRLHDRLIPHFGADKIFMDIDNIEPGEDFVEVINRELNSCAIFIVLIGQRWLITTEESGRRRLDNPDDFVRLEIATALNRKIRVIPVIVENASMPSSSELPDDLAPLARRQAVFLDHASFDSDVERFINYLDRVLNR